MGALRNQIFIGSLDAPLFYFENDNVESVDSIQSVDVIGDKLAIDTFTPVVFYEGTEIDELRTLPFGTPVWHYNKGVLRNKFYIDEVERQTRTKFELSCVSAIGILDKFYHQGNVYTGQTFSEVLNEMLGESIPYEVDPVVADIAMYGYLPYDTCRNNLHQMLFATNVTILKNDDGDMYFTYVDPYDEIDYIDEERLYISGKVTYPKVATKIRLAEHTYIYTENIEEVQLADNSSSSPYSHQLYVFDTAPIYVDSLRTEGELTIEESGVNYAILSGSGILYGVPYYDKISVVTRTHKSRGADYTLTVDDATLVNPANSEYVADRLMSYYASEKTVEGSLKVSGEKTGKIYRFTDAFGETVTGYLGKVASHASSFIKGDCEFVSGYEGNNFGNTYTHHAIATIDSKLIIPSDATKLKLIIIGGGDGGSSGFAGTQKTYEEDGVTEYLEYGIGGDPGEPGRGGDILEVLINNPNPGTYECTIGDGGSGSQYGTSDSVNRPGGTGTSSSIVIGSKTYSSSDSGSYRSVFGYLDIFNNTVYARSGIPGIRGGNGGRGSTEESGEDGESVTYLGVVYKGGKGASKLTTERQIDESTISFGGGGGEGAMAFCDGANAPIAHIWDHIISGNTEVFSVETSMAGNADYVLPKDVKTAGCGGRAGCGGAGRGGAGKNGNIYSYGYVNNVNYTFLEDCRRSDSVIGHSKYGTPGAEGANGIIIAYSDSKIKFMPSKINPPIAKGLDSRDSNDYAYFEISNLVPGIQYSIVYQANNSGEWLDAGSVAISSGDSDVFTAAISPKFSALIRCRGLGYDDVSNSKWSNECWIGRGVPKLNPPTYIQVYSGCNNNKPYLCMTYSYDSELAGTKKLGIRHSTDGEDFKYISEIETYANKNLTGWVIFRIGEIVDIMPGSTNYISTYLIDKSNNHINSDMSTTSYVVPSDFNALSIPYIVASGVNINNRNATIIHDIFIADSRISKIQFYVGDHDYSLHLLKEIAITSSDFETLKIIDACTVNLDIREIEVRDQFSEATLIFKFWDYLYFEARALNSDGTVVSEFSPVVRVKIPS